MLYYVIQLNNDVRMQVHDYIFKVMCIHKINHNIGRIDYTLN